MYKPSIIVVTDFDIRNKKGASGYTNIAVPICTQLAEKYNVIGLGFSYERAEHEFPFGINLVPFKFLPSAMNTITRGAKIRNIVIMADIPLQTELLKFWQKPDGVNYIGVFAVESDPVCASAAMDILSMDKRLAISQFGVDELAKVGIEAEHLVVPLDLNTWKLRTREEYDSAREMMGLSNKEVFFFNADGNERKNISGLFEGFKLALEKNSNLHLVLLTRINSGANWKLHDLANFLGISKNLTIIDRGISSDSVRNLYVTADWYLNMTKAEGLGMGILEAMAVGVPAVVTDATAMKELATDRGILVPWQYKWIDPFLNGNRYFVFPETMANQILYCAELRQNKPELYTEMIAKSRAFVESRTVENAASILERQFVFDEVKDEQKA